MGERSRLSRTKREKPRHSSAHGRIPPTLSHLGDPAVRSPRPATAPANATPPTHRNPPPSLIRSRLRRGSEVARLARHSAPGNCRPYPFVQSERFPSSATREDRPAFTHPAFPTFGQDMPPRSGFPLRPRPYLNRLTSAGHPSHPNHRFPSSRLNGGWPWTGLAVLYAPRARWAARTGLTRLGPGAGLGLR